ncbi:TELO2-interacting protein 2-like [Thrips palmi]|uniref:TELO2-interacting protein 2-like n=1 Tax=Thrips palmi TaxID=161013 RepID=A0A6P8YEU4_THRPL|nr:TELO2-interacting protein 2-like [Thrips palmi]
MIESVDSDIVFLNSINLTADVLPSSWVSLGKVIKASLLPEQTYGEDRPAEEADFESHRKDVVNKLKSVLNFIRKFVSIVPSQVFDRDLLVWLLILCGEHHFPDLWTTDETREVAVLCVQELCSFYDCSSVSQLVLGQSQKSSPCFKQALVILRPKLLRNSWRKNPGAIASYKWLLVQLCAPHLSEYLDIVSPTTLLILDDHDEGRRLLGLQCMLHIIDNVARTELCQRGLHQVFYKTLEPMMWQRTPSQIELVFTCITHLLSLTERGYTRSSEPGMWDMFDDTLSTLLDTMVFEDQIPLRLAYIKSLGPLLSAMGPQVIRWSKPLVAVFDEYLHKDSFDTRKYALEAMRTYICLSSPRMSQNGDNILFLLLRTCQDISEDNTTSDELHLVKNCVSMMRLSAPKDFQNVLLELQNLSCTEKMHEQIMNVFGL